MPRIVALYKTFCGPEFVAASLASIYPHVDGIVMVHSTVGWDKSTGNRVQEQAQAWSREHDVDGKVHHVTTDIADQPAQYAFGLQRVRDRFGAVDFIMLVDTDEIWDGAMLEKAKGYLFADRRHTRFTCHMHTYVKSALFRVCPPEFCHPTIFLRNVPGLALLGPRGNGVNPTVYWSDIYFHHLTYVRETDEQVFSKINTSNIGDGEKSRDLVAWRTDCWDKLPYALNLNVTLNHEKSWARVLELSLGELPPSLQNHPLVQRHWAERQAQQARYTDTPVSIIVPTCRSLHQVAPLVQEITRRSTGVFEVIPTCHVGKSAAINRNAGLRAAKHGAVIMIDDDIYDLPYGWNQQLISHLSDPSVSMISARLLAPNGQVAHLMGNAPVVIGQATVAKERKLATACVAFRRSTLRFDERFIGSGYEDDDYCLQLRKQNNATRFLVDNAVLVTHRNEMKNQKGQFATHNQRHLKKKWRLP